MQPFKYAHATADSWEIAAQACLSRLGQVTEENLGFLYITDLLEDDVGDILEFFKQRTRIEHWVGTTGSGICTTAQEYFNVPAIAVMLTEFPESSFQIFTNLTKQRDFEHFSRQHQSWCDSKFPMFSVVHGDPRNNNIADLIYQFSERLGEGFLVGGLTSSQNNQARFLQIADDVLEEEPLGLSGVMFSSATPVATRLSQGCSVIGPRHEITEADQNVIIRINGLPALNVFNEDIGKELASDLNKVAGYIFVALPIQGSDTGDYLVRNLVGIDPDNRLLAVGEFVEPGMQIMFARRDVRTAREDLIRILKNLKQDLKGRQPRGGLYYSCLGRGESLFGSDSQELKTIQDVLGDFPLVGFFANGEIYHQRLYGYTGTLTLFL